MPQHDRRAGQAGLPAQQILHGAVPGAQGGHRQDHPGGLQGRVGRPEGGGGAGAALHQLPERDRRPLRGAGGDLAHRV